MVVVPVLVISGSMGSGKTTVLSEASGLLAEASIPHAALDLDCLTVSSHLKEYMESGLRSQISPRFGRFTLMLVQTDCSSHVLSRIGQSFSNTAKQCPGPSPSSAD